MKIHSTHPSYPRELAPSQRTYASMPPSFTSSTLQTSYNPLKWTFALCNLFLDTFSSFYRFSTSFIWRSKLAPFPAFELPVLDTERRNFLNDTMEKSSKTHYLSLSSPSHEQKLQVLHRIYAFQQYLTRCTSSKNLLVGKIKLTNSQIKQPFEAPCDKLDYSKLFAFLDKLGTSYFSSDSSILLQFSCCRLTQTGIGAIQADFKSFGQWYNMRTNTVKADNLPCSVPNPMQFYTDTGAQEEVAIFLQNE